MGQYCVMIKPASSLCNLRCKYCFYSDVSNERNVKSYGIMKLSVAEQALKNIKACLKPDDILILSFQGGEPTLAGLGFFEGIAEIVSSWGPKVRVQYTIQTNGTLLDENWCRFLKKHHFLVGVSFDILPECHEEARVDSLGKGSYKQVQAAINLLERYRVEYNILCTLTNAIARHPQQIWKKILEYDFRYVQFTPCIGQLQLPGKNQYALTPQRFSRFYQQIFQNWYADYCTGNYRSIKLFDDLINYMAFGVPTACGMGGFCTPQLVVEADGSVFPCDFYCIDEYKLGNIAEQSIQDLLSGTEVQKFVHRESPQPKLCHDCRWKKLCGGGCKRMRKEICCNGEDNFCGYKSFLDNTGNTLSEIVRKSLL